MSTPLTLSVGDIDLTYNTHQIGIDHGHLFQEEDRKRRSSLSVDYACSEEYLDEDVAQMEMCLTRPLGSMLSRLELLGYTMESVRAEYERGAAAHRDREADDPGESGKTLLTFDGFLDFVRTHAICALSNDFPADIDAAERTGRWGRFADDVAASSVPRAEWWQEVPSYSERSYFGNLLGFLSPYSALRVLAENPDNIKLDVVWDYGAFVSAGWAENNEFITGARREQTYLIATEGTSDTHI